MPSRDNPLRPHFQRSTKPIDPRLLERYGLRRVGDVPRPSLPPAVVRALWNRPARLWDSAADRLVTLLQRLR